MPAGDDETLGGEKAKLEVFDGSSPGKYRLWKRRAQLMLASLPSTISEKKHGPKLMGFIGGEAEALLEHLEVSKICSEGGDQLIWQVLDEKYGPQQIDLLQESLKGFFYELAVKQGESFRQFAARFAAARRKLEEQKIQLPEVVLGFMFMKKLKLDATGESMLMTTTKGNLELKEVEKAVQAVFPEGKGVLNRGTSKDVFQAEVQGNDEDADDDEMQNVMELMADEIQSRAEWEEEDILEAFESYSEIRKKIAEQKRNRGYYPPASDRAKTESWKVTGSIRGRIESLKSRTRCHRCKKFGHWKKECPMNASGSGSSQENRSKEVMIVDEEDPAVQKLWEAFLTEDVSKVVSWDAGLQDDVRNSGFADSHSTGNRQRCDEPKKPTVVHQSERRLESEMCDVFSAEDVLSADRDPQLSMCGVPDTACRRTLVGSDTLALIEKHLKGQGLKAQRAKVQNSFRFGNSGTILSEETVLLPAKVGSKRFVIKAAVLPNGGKQTPLLMSKELLKQLGGVLDMSRDECRFEKLGCVVKLRETMKGHYAICCGCRVLCCG